MSNKMAEKLTNFRVFLDGDDQIGVADVQLPELTAMTDTVKGAGIAGEVETPIIGHFSSLAMTINWRVTTKNSLKLAIPKAHDLELRGSVQEYDASTGEYRVWGQKVVVKAIPKKAALGKLDVGTGQDTTSEFEVNYIKVFIDGDEVLELDKYNYIFKVEGTDYLDETRTALGL
ncbi:MAG: phage major tail tube protein [Desulfobacteraceae bacterium]|nr:phage major tail tube protein [Desulfobacteraceae bacterium]